MARAIRLALDDAGLKPKDIDYICADAAGTVDGDITETKAIKQVFGEYAKQVAISAPKSVYGNMLGACGALDVITTVLAMEHSIVPPTINLENPDPECDLDYCANKAKEKTIKNALIINRGRGGINCALILQKS